MLLTRREYSLRWAGSKEESAELTCCTTLLFWYLTKRSYHADVVSAYDYDIYFVDDSCKYELALRGRYFSP